MSRRIAVYCGTRNLYSRMEVLARGLIANDGADRVFFLIEDRNFAWKDERDIPDEIVTCLDVSDQQFFWKDGPNYDNPWTWMVLMRAAIPRLFGECERVLSLDTDTLVYKPIDELWRMDLGDMYLAAVPELTERRTGNPKYNRPPYFNFGVSMLNIPQLRKDGKDIEIIQMINEEPLEYNEQDAFNIACYKKIFPLEPRFGCISAFYPQEEENANIVHYCSQDKQVFMAKRYNQYRRMTWKEALESQKRLQKAKIENSLEK